MRVGDALPFPQVQVPSVEGPALLRVEQSKVEHVACPNSRRHHLCQPLERHFAVRGAAAESAVQPDDLLPECAHERMRAPRLHRRRANHGGAAARTADLIVHYSSVGPAEACHLPLRQVVCAPAIVPCGTSGVHLRERDDRRDVAVARLEDMQTARAREIAQRVRALDTRVQRLTVRDDLES